MNQPLNARPGTKPEAPKTAPEPIDLPQTCVRIMEALEGIAETLERFAVKEGILKEEDALYLVVDDEQS